MTPVPRPDIVLRQHAEEDMEHFKLIEFHRAVRERGAPNPFRYDANAYGTKYKNPGTYTVRVYNSGQSPTSPRPYGPRGGGVVLVFAAILLGGFVFALWAKGWV